MRRTDMTVVQGPVVEEEVRFTLVELCQACDAQEQSVVAWVLEGVLEPAGESPQDWRFGGESLRRARMAWRLSQDLGINPPGIALALDLLDEIASLEARLRREGGV
jgi:chaperone modulatory protein CbpM